MRPETGTILLFAKASLPGEVKTRLIPAVGAEGAAMLYQELLAGAAATASGVQGSRVELWCAPDTSHPGFRELSLQWGMTLHSQAGDDLGERMAHAATRGLAVSSRVILIGADCPALTRDYLSRAMASLERGVDAVIGPAEDGGYVLLGLRRFSPRLFSGIAWGGDSVLAQTRAVLRELAWRWVELETLWDLDRPADLARYRDLRSATEGNI
jgi:rSAM/selenodomain-associated transferase 1